MNRILFTGLGLALALTVMPLAAQTPPYVRTIIVGGAGAPVTNGNNLISALAGIASPSATNRWLVKLEPGTFDLATRALVLRDYVDVEGSGRGVTTITSAITQVDPVIDPVTGTVIAPGGATIFGPAGVHAEVRELLARNIAPANYGAALYSRSNDVRLSRLDVELDSANGGSGIVLELVTAQLFDLSIRLKASNIFSGLVGIYVVGGAPRLSQIRESADLSSNGGHRGVSLQNSAAIVDDLIVSAPVTTLVNQYNIGLEIVGNQPTITNSLLTVGGAQCHGILLTNSAQPEIRNTVATATNGYYAAGLTLQTGSVAKIYSSRLKGQGSPNGIGIAPDNSTTAIVHSSAVEGTTNAYVAFGNLTFATSQLIGTRPGGATCIFSYDVSFLPLSGAC